MRRLLALLVPILSLAATPLAAQQIAYASFGEDEIVVTEELTGVEEGSVPVPIPIPIQIEAPEPGANARFVHSTAAPVPQGIATYGPFRVLDTTRAALVDATDERSPAAFAALLRDHPGIASLEMVECPGTFDDRANLKLGRMIHARGIATHVPDGGSVRSGAVELFLAGTRRTAAPRAEFAVHSWADEDGLEAADYSPNAPENRAYLDYYKEMGMTTAEASAFYAMTNSVPNADAKWLSAADMRQWVRLD